MCNPAAERFGDCRIRAREVAMIDEPVGLLPPVISFGSVVGRTSRPEDLEDALRGLQHVDGRFT